MNQVVNETLPALVELKKKGIVGHVGITDLQLENLKWIIDHSEPGTVESVLNFCHYCLNDEKLIIWIILNQRISALSMPPPFQWAYSPNVGFLHGIRPPNHW